MSRLIILSILIFFLPIIANASVEFDGTDDFLTCGSGASIDNLTNRSYVVWAKLSTTSNGDYFMVEKNNAINGPEFMISISGGTPSLFLWFSGTVAGGGWSQSLTGYDVTKWHMYAMTFDKSSLSNDPTFYVDGTQYTPTETNTPLGSYEDDSGQNFNIGAENDAPGGYFNGQIRNVAVYNTILSQSEISDIYLHNGYKYTTGLKAYWSLTDGADGTSADTDTAGDSSGNGNNCTGNDGANNTGLTWRITNLSKAQLNQVKVVQWK